MRLYYLESKMKEKQVTPKQLAKAIDMKIGPLYKRLSGKVIFNVEDAGKVGDYLKLSPEEFLKSFYFF